MSLCFMMNLDEGVVIASDGRITKTNNNSNEIENAFDYFPKVQPLTSNSILFVSGIIQASESVRSSVKNDVSDNSSFEEIASSIQKNCIEGHNRYKNLSSIENIGVVVGALAYYDKQPCHATFSSKNNFTPHIINDNCRYDFMGIGTKEASRYFEDIAEKYKQNVGIIDLVYATFKHVSSQMPEVGGKFTAYLLNQKGIYLSGERMI